MLVRGGGSDGRGHRRPAVKVVPPDQGTPPPAPATGPLEVASPEVPSPGRPVSVSLSHAGAPSPALTELVRQVSRLFAPSSESLATARFLYPDWKGNSVTVEVGSSWSVRVFGSQLVVTVPNPNPAPQGLLGRVVARLRNVGRGAGKEDRSPAAVDVAVELGFTRPAGVDRLWSAVFPICRRSCTTDQDRSELVLDLLEAVRSFAETPQVSDVWRARICQVLLNRGDLTLSSESSLQTVMSLARHEIPAGGIRQWSQGVRDVVRFFCRAHIERSRQELAPAPRTDTLLERVRHGCEEIGRVTALRRLSLVRDIQEPLANLQARIIALGDEIPKGVARCVERCALGDLEELLGLTGRLTQLIDCHRPKADASSSLLLLRQDLFDVKSADAIGEIGARLRGLLSQYEIFAQGNAARETVSSPDEAVAQWLAAFRSLDARIAEAGDALLPAEAFQLAVFLSRLEALERNSPSLFRQIVRNVEGEAANGKSALRNDPADRNQRARNSFYRIGQSIELASAQLDTQRALDLIGQGRFGIAAEVVNDVQVRVGALGNPADVTVRLGEAAAALTLAEARRLAASGSISLLVEKLQPPRVDDGQPADPIPERFHHARAEYSQILLSALDATPGELSGRGNSIRFRTELLRLRSDYHFPVEVCVALDARVESLGSAVRERLDAEVLVAVRDAASRRDPVEAERVVAEFRAGRAELVQAGIATGQHTALAPFALEIATLLAQPMRDLLPSIEAPLEAVDLFLLEYEDLQSTALGFGLHAEAERLRAAALEEFASRRLALAGERVAIGANSPLNQPWEVFCAPFEQAVTDVRAEASGRFDPSRGVTRATEMFLDRIFQRAAADLRNMAPEPLPIREIERFQNLPAASERHVQERERAVADAVTRALDAWNQRANEALSAGDAKQAVHVLNDALRTTCDPGFGVVGPAYRDGLLEMVATHRPAVIALVGQHAVRALTSPHVHPEQDEILAGFERDMQGIGASPEECQETRRSIRVAGAGIHVAKIRDAPHDVQLERIRAVEGWLRSVESDQQVEALRSELDKVGSQLVSGLLDRLHAGRDKARETTALPRGRAPWAIEVLRDLPIFRYATGLTQVDNFLSACRSVALNADGWVTTGEERAAVLRQRFRRRIGDAKTRYEEVIKAYGSPADDDQSEHAQLLRRLQAIVSTAEVYVTPGAEQKAAAAALAAKLAAKRAREQAAIERMVKARDELLDNVAMIRDFSFRQWAVLPVSAVQIVEQEQALPPLPAGKRYAPVRGEGYAMWFVADSIERKKKPAKKGEQEATEKSPPLPKIVPPPSVPLADRGYLIHGDNFVANFRAGGGLARWMGRYLEARAAAMDLLGSDPLDELLLNADLEPVCIRETFADLSDRANELIGILLRLGTPYPEISVMGPDDLRAVSAEISVEDFLESLPNGTAEEKTRGGKAQFPQLNNRRVFSQLSSEQPRTRSPV